MTAPTPSPALPVQDLSGLVGAHFIHTHAATGCIWEVYIRNATTIDYRALGGRLRGRRVLGQTVDLVRLGDDDYRLTWGESIGCFSLIIRPARRYIHQVVTLLHSTSRDPAPTCWIELLTEFRDITFLETRCPNDDTVLGDVPATQIETVG
ncbi:phenolic acid decarboxylase [Nocardia transvalensis]|uniref:phenolic acid decarboxylase n=1 Tax=Nocardia transvalensis TaxID=37333 RepID=UPI001895EC23|nr:phenolic acid decarboxylase [Nocardia transvalensis]MBF6332221.1 phenolic acid decarboxylase [Nocardia transvalensis]